MKSFHLISVILDIAATWDTTLIGKVEAATGTDAMEERLGGCGGAGIGVVSILDGNRKRAGEGTTVRYASGCGRFLVVHR